MNARTVASMYTQRDLPGLLAVCRTIAEASSPLQVGTPSDIAPYLVAQLSGEPQEHSLVVCLDTRNNVVHTEHLYKGTLNGSFVRPAEVFKPAILHNAAGIVFSHNHPSGDPSPSPEDIALTRALFEAGKLLDIDLLDHIILGNAQWTSLKAKGWGFD